MLLRRWAFISAIERTGTKRRLSPVSTVLRLRPTPPIPSSLCRETGYGITGPVAASSKNPGFRPSSAWHVNTAGPARDAGRNDSERRQLLYQQWPEQRRGLRVFKAHVRHRISHSLLTTHYTLANKKHKRFNFLFFLQYSQLYILQPVRLDSSGPERIKCEQMLLTDTPAVCYYTRL